VHPPGFARVRPPHPPPLKKQKIKKIIKNKKKLKIIPKKVFKKMEWDPLLEAPIPELF
jgi:hypothetical protein